MAKYLLLILTLALVAASIAKHGGAFADDDGDDLAQRQEAMEVLLRVFSNPVLAEAADSETVRRTALFLKREIGPLGPIFEAICTMLENTAADVRDKDEAFDAAFEMLMRHFLPLAPPGWGKTDEL